MYHALFILCSISLYRCVLLFSKVNLRNSVYLSLVLVKIIVSSFIIWTFFCVKTGLRPTSYILLMDINKLCIIPARMWPSLDFGGGCDNANVNSLFDTIVPPFDRTTVIGGLLYVVY